MSGSQGVGRVLRRAVYRALVGGAAAAVAVVTSAHIGSPNVFYDGAAGPYPVRVIVRPPAVVPGIAEVTVRLTGLSAAAAPADVPRVVVRPVFWRAGAKGAPTGDDAVRVAGAPDTYTGQLWLMSAGASSVYVTVSGARGSGTAIVPVRAVATGRPGMQSALKGILMVLGTMLFAGLLTIVHAATGEAQAAPSEPVEPRRRRRARLVTALALPVVALIVLGGARWWGAVDRAYARSMAKPLAVRATVLPAGEPAGARRLAFTITDSAWAAGGYTPLMPDHGKIMHMFLVRVPALDQFAHLHPVRRDSVTFENVLPPLAAGRYRVYGDVVHESGFERTLVATVDLPPPADARVAERAAAGTNAGGDVDDSWSALAAARVAPGQPAAVALPNGGQMIWLPDSAPPVAGRETTLRFEVRDETGVPAQLEPYTGMMAHAAITRPDGSVFIHLHPTGTFSMAAQESFARRDRGDTTADGRLKQGGAVAASMSHGATGEHGRVAFPYAFPTPGPYRVWVQVKHNARVLTGAFDVEVGAAPE